MIAAERVRNYSDAALSALAYADLVGVRSPEGAASLERQAQVYATLHRADMALRSRMIATVAELDALPEDSVILDDGWYPKVKGSNGKWWRQDCPRGIAARGMVLPTRLLWTPED
jgi:hypothetical protein